MDDVAGYILHIYKSCDSSNADSVPASTLIDFIKPFMPENLNELNQLHAKLDPDETNPSLNYSCFYKIMSDWIAKVDKRDLSSGFAEMNASISEEGYHSSQVFGVGLSPNVSKTTKTNGAIVSDEVTLEEKVQMLQHQLYKTTNELELLKQQLIASEELNESLSADLSRLHKLHCREQQFNEEITKNKSESDEIKEETDIANKKIQQLGKILAEYEKQKETFLAHISQLENENATLKIKTQKLEKGQIQRTKSISELEDTLDEKESEISDLMEVINELRRNLDEKNELVEFYLNENKLIKEKYQALESFIQEMFPEGDIITPKTPEANITFQIYNSPKLLNQLSNPVTPSLDSPLNFKKRPTSSPIKKVAANPDLFSNGNIVTVLRTPHKTLKEELSQVITNGKVEDEIKRLQEALKEQDVIKNNLWENMKHLSHDNETLRIYKKGYEELEYNIQEKEEMIESLKHETSILKSQFSVDKSVLKEDKFTETKGDNSIQVLNNTSKENKYTETENEDGNNTIQQLESKIKLLQTKLEKQEQVCVNLREKIEKVVCDKSTETEREGIWTFQIPEVVESKRTNYDKQQIKLEKLKVKQEKIEKDLATERSLNTVLSSKQQELYEENQRIKNDLEYYKEKSQKQLEDIKSLLNTKHSLSENIEVLENENETLQHENLSLAEEMRSLANEKFNLENNLKRLTIEVSVLPGIRTENEQLVTKFHRLEAKLKEECIKQIHFKKQIDDLRTTHNLKLIELQKEIALKNNEIHKLLSKQIEVLNIETFLSVNNKELSSLILNILNTFNFENEIEDGLLSCVNKDEANSLLEKEMMTLNYNVKFISRLYEIVADKYSRLLNANESLTQKCNETFSILEPISMNSVEKEVNFDSQIDLFSTTDSSFDTCFTDISVSVKEYLELTSLNKDSFLDNLELNDEDLRDLTLKEMEEKFTALVLTLTLDFKTSNRRYLNQKEKYNQLLTKYFTYLNYVINQMEKINMSDKREIFKSTLTYLNLVKNISEEILQEAFNCGLLQYEKRTINCWQLMINYVAELNRENKQIKQLHNVSESQDLKKTLVPIALDNQVTCIDEEFLLQSRSNPWKKLKFCVSVFLLFVFVIFTMLVFYVDNLCQKTGRRSCPVEWIVSYFVRKEHAFPIL